MPQLSTRKNKKIIFFQKNSKGKNKFFAMPMPMTIPMMMLMPRCQCRDFQMTGNPLNLIYSLLEFGRLPRTGIPFIHLSFIPFFGIPYVTRTEVFEN